MRRRKIWFFGWRLEEGRFNWFGHGDGSKVVERGRENWPWQFSLLAWRERDRCNEVKLGREESLSWKTKKRVEKENSLSLSNLISKHKNFDTNTTPRTVIQSSTMAYLKFQLKMRAFFVNWLLLFFSLSELPPVTVPPPFYHVLPPSHHQTLHSHNYHPPRNHRRQCSIRFRSGKRRDKISSPPPPIRSFLLRLQPLSSSRTTVYCNPLGPAMLWESVRRWDQEGDIDENGCRWEKKKIAGGL